MKKTTLSKIFGVAVVIALLASLIIAAVPTSAISYSGPGVTVTPATISAPAVYKIDFTGSFALDDTDIVTVVFPSGTTVPATLASVTMTNGQGQGGATTYSTIPAANTVYIDVPTTILGFNVGYIWSITITGITNPGTPGTYALSLATNVGDAVSQTIGTPIESAVSSPTYTISVPTQVSVYNDAGNFLGTKDNIDLALDIVPSHGTVKAGPGTYIENPSTADASLQYVTITSTSSATDTIIQGNLTLAGSDTYVTLSNFTVKGSVIVNGNNDTISGCVFTKLNANPISYFVQDNGLDLTITGCSFDTTLGSSQDTAIVLTAVGGTAPTFTQITNCTFSLNQSAALQQDVAISATAGATFTASGCTFTGSSGIGYTDAAGANATIKNGTFTSLQSAAVIDAVSTFDFEGNTVNTCTSLTGSAATGAIEIRAVANQVIVANNVIKGSAGYSMIVTSAPTLFSVAGNQFSGNALGIKALAGTYPLNYWGAAGGPGATGSDVTTDSTIQATAFQPFLGVAPSAANATFASPAWTIPYSYDFTASGASGVQINNVTGATTATMVVAQKLSTNPVTLTPPYPSVAYYDVYMSTAPTTTTVQINFFTTGITNATQVYYWSGAAGNWVLTDSLVAGTGTYVYVTINDTTAPAWGDLTAGIYFVVVSGLPPAPANFDVNSPVLGSTTGLTNIPFSWAPYTGATSYEFILSANADLSSPVVDQQNLSGTAFTYTGTLQPGPYYWVVNAYLNNAIKAKSVTGTFIAESPTTTATATGTVITITSVPAPTITITQPAATTITIPAAQVTEITPAWIWGIIGIGAVLIIVVIVLIVRTRRSV